MVKEYIETVRAPFPGVSAGDKEIGADEMDIRIHLDDDRFPIAPRISSEKEMKKSDLEHLYRDYLTQHYRESL